MVTQIFLAVCVNSFISLLSIRLLFKEVMVCQWQSLRLKTSEGKLELSERLVFTLGFEAGERAGWRRGYR